MEEKLYYLGFSLFPGVRSVLFHKLLQEFGSAETTWDSPDQALRQTVGEKLTGKFVAFRKTIHLEKEYEKYVQKDIQLVALEDKVYPFLLKEIQRHAFLLYVKGNLEVLSAQEIISVVGTRKITSYGRQVTEIELV